jgi:hypothetical protein
MFLPVLCDIFRPFFRVAAAIGAVGEKDVGEGRVKCNK